LFIKINEGKKISFQLYILSILSKYTTVATILLTVIFFFFLSLSNTFAQSLKELLKDQSGDLPWSISADSMSYDRKASLYVGKGHVVIERGTTRLTAANVMFDPDDMIAEAKGDVFLTTGNDQLICQRMKLDLKTETGTLYQGSVFMSEGHFYIKGDKIEKTGNKSYFAQKATITTCDSEHPDWKLTARKVNITLEGYGMATHASLWAKSIPLLYSPFFAFPVKIKRQTGLLTPRMGTSMRKGLSYEQPFFWAINDQSDITLNYNYMEQRGHQFGLEYRYLLSPNAKGMMMFDGLDDAKVDDGIGDNSDSWGYADDTNDTNDTNGIDYLRPNNERYWFRMKHNQSLFAGYTAKLDLDLVSDQDYLPEFKNTNTGFLRSQEAYQDFFGRDFNDYTDITRKNTINISKTWTHYNLNAGTRWTDHVVNRNLNYNDPTVQYLPSIDFNSSKHRLGRTPLNLALNSQYTYLYRQDSIGIRTTTGSHRLDLYPRIYLPFSLGNYLNIEPSFGVRSTAWLPTNDEDPKAKENETLNRELWDARLDFSNAFYRIFKPKIGTIDRIKHDIKPKITYQYLPRMDQDEYPHFDLVDRIPSKNLITYSLTNSLTYRKQPSLPVKDDTLKSSPVGPIYHQFARLYLEQSYDLSDGQDPYKCLQYNEYSDINEEYCGDYPFSELYGRLEVTPQRRLSLDADAKWSVYDGQFKTGNLALNMWNQRQDRLKLEYRFAERTTRLNANGNPKESFYTNAILKLTNQLNLFGLWERDLYTDTELEYGGGFIYASQCWSIEAAHTVESNDHRYFLTFELYGLGKIGT
jgi:LPS-assembly protein